MNIEEFRTYCLSKKHVSESFPFDQQTLVFKVGDKMFSLTSLEKHPTSVNLKCDPERAIELRDSHSEITAGYHMSKKHWNTIVIESSLPHQLLKELIDHSYELVVSGMTKKQRTELES
ncbi:MAG: MmcQ/YjbR family DNA-binding protein [Lutibacter sp.]|nr:MmcQ/YjbR family DNA-binding protein [Lutibacter sp.]MBP9602102.1 MmcQ/YjbR family DNA-binding protein [Lutibacter sp.]